jgi:hypothetical protein
MATNITLKTSCKSLAGGTTAVSAVQQAETAAVGGTWATGDKLGVILTNNYTGAQTLVGNGNATGAEPVYFFTLDKKLYFVAGATVYFSAISLPTKFNDQSTIGNSLLTISNCFANAENIAAMALFQGKLAFISRRTTTIYNIDADPAKWTFFQTLQNVGTLSGASVHSIGELETLFLADNGIRSLRARVSAENAEVNDLGSPIDSLVVAKLAASTATQKAAACGIVEPSSDRYWCFLNDTIYVLSYFQSAQIIAWSTYLPTYEVTATKSGATYSGGAVTFSGLTPNQEYQWTKGAQEGTLTCGAQSITATGFFTPATAVTTASVAGTTGQSYTGTLTTQVAFTPQNFVTLNGQVFTRDGDALYAYGGSDGITYDRTSAVADTPFLDAQSPASSKQLRGIDVVCDGSWIVSTGTNIANSSTLVEAYRNSGSSLATGRVPIMQRATHLKMRFKSFGTGTAANPSRMSKAILHFESGAEK